MSGPFTYHHFNIVVAQRKSKCKAGHHCTPYDSKTDAPFGPGTIFKGETCVQVTTGSHRSERNARYCLKCAVETIQHFKSPFDAVIFELTKHKGIREVKEAERTWRDDLEDQYMNAPHSNHSYWSDEHPHFKESL